MKEWIEISISATSKGAGVVSDILTAQGITGIQIKDPADFEEFLKSPEANWDYIDDSLMELQKGEAQVIFYVSNNGQGQEVLEEVEKALEKLAADSKEDMGSLKIRQEYIDEDDWSNEWKKYFHPVKVGKKLVICPSWEEYEKKADETVVILNPGMAFGTGQHDTTRLCMELLEENVSGGEKLLDVGCGSGILAVSGVLLGAGLARGVDIDEGAVKVAKDNALMNGCEDKTEFYTGVLNSVPQIRDKYDIICMNIVADVIISLLEEVKNYMADDAVLILSGIIDEREKDVKDALALNGFTLKNRLFSKGWAAYECVL